MHFVRLNVAVAATTSAFFVKRWQDKKSRFGCNELKFSFFY